MRKRVWNFEAKLKREGRNEIARACLKEIESRERSCEYRESEWERARERVKREWGGEGEWEGIEERMRMRDSDERWEKIVSSRYNRWYKLCRSTRGILLYLEMVKKECKWQRMIKFRLGEEMNEAKYWMNDEEKLCRVCGCEVESWEHVLDRCGSDEGWDRSLVERVRKILHEGGRGLGWMGKLMEKRDSVKRALDKGGVSVGSGSGGDSPVPDLFPKILK